MTWFSRGSSVVGRARAVAVAGAILVTVAGCGTSTAGTAIRGSEVVAGISTRPNPGLTTTSSARPTPSTTVARTPSDSAAPTQAGSGADEVADLARLVIEAHGDLTSVTKATHNRDPYSVDNYTSVQMASGGRVLQKVTFEPTTSAIFGIEEIRCIGDQNFLTPIPFDIEVQADDAHPWVAASAQPGDDAPDSEQLTSYFCDAGYPTGLGYDFEFLLSAADYTDLGDVDHQGEQVRHLVVDVPVRDAYLIPGLSWVGGDAGVPDDGPVQVELLLGSDDLVRRLTSQVQLDGRDLGVEIDFSDFNSGASVEPPDPAQVAQR